MSIEAQCPAMTHAWKISWYLHEPRGWGPGLCAWTAARRAVYVRRPPRVRCIGARRVRAEYGRAQCSRDLAKQPRLSRARVRQGLARALHCPLLACEVGEARDMLH